MRLEKKIKAKLPSLVVRDIFERSMVGMAITSLEKGWVEVNERLCEMLGFSKEELAHKTWAELTHPDDLATDVAEFNRVLAGDINEYTLDKRFIHSDGHVVYAHIAVHCVRRADDSIDCFVALVADISKRKLAEDGLRESEELWRALSETALDHIMLVGLDGIILFINRTVADLTREAVIGTSQLNYVPPEYHQITINCYNHVMESGKPDTYTVEYHAKDGVRYFEVRVSPIFKDGRIISFLNCSTDITERMQTIVSLQRAASVFEHAREGIMITDLKGTIVDVNESFTRITGYTSEDAIGQNSRILNSGRQNAAFYKAIRNALTAQGHWSGELWNRRKDGELYAELLTISAICDKQGITQQYVALFSDISAIKAHQSELEHIAHFDALTNLPNRVLLADRLHQAMTQAQRRQKRVAVAYLDLDGFKAINDHHGHEAGDQVLITVAKRLKESLRDGDTIARMGGDEFVAVLADLEDTSTSVPLLNRLLSAAASPVQVGNLNFQVSASLGVSFYPQAQEIEADQLLRQADQAMYQAKVAGKNRYSVFDAAHDSLMRGHHESMERIRLALKQREFVLYYQPKVNMHSGKVIGAEALIRWLHPEKGILAPAIFLPVIEDDALAVEVGEWVIDTVMHQIGVWHAAGLDLPVSVNIGARQLQQSDFVERLLAILARYPQINSACLELEVLETSALADMEQVSQVIEACAKIGVKFALDDFGTGYSSLTYLKRLRVTQLKIDQSFVRDMLDDPDDLAILRGIIGLAAAFKREVIAEGVETVAHGTALLQLGCELAQGYGIARPMPPDQLPAWAAAWQPDAAWFGESIKQ
jgi:diguanylate cyclase (GGDEF)-like protein/PAS domain S-box-containing protein